MASAASLAAVRLGLPRGTPSCCISDHAVLKLGTTVRATTNSRQSRKKEEGDISNRRAQIGLLRVLRMMETLPCRTD